ncbi:Regulator of nonsense transcripts 3A [Schistosoma japonicum]|nr:Regulator of nonsense transcripts 3A [Schistosoma japonicum]
MITYNVRLSANRKTGVKHTLTGSEYKPFDDKGFYSIMVGASSLKIVVRRLPPKLKANDFIKIVNPLPSHTYFRFCDADDSLGALGLTRAYIAFSDIDSLFDFKERFDGYIFLDCESSALVEFALCQALASAKVPLNGNKRDKVDKKQGSLLGDSEYIEFVKSMESAELCGEVSESESKKSALESILDDLQTKESNVVQTQIVTPLLTYLNNRDGDIRRKDEESSRHRQFRQINSSVTKKVFKVDKSLRNHTSLRRLHDSKNIFSDRFSIHGISRKESPHHNSTENLTKPDLKTQKNSKSQWSVTLDASEFPAIQTSQAASDKLTTYPSKNPSNKADSKPFSRNIDSVLENNTRLGFAELEGYKTSEYVTKPTFKQLLPRGQTKQTLCNQSESARGDQILNQDNAFRAKKGNYSVTSASSFITEVRKQSIVLVRDKRDSDANIQNCVSGNFLVDDQENQCNHERCGSISKSMLRGRDNRHVTISNHETYNSSSRNNYRGSQQISKETLDYREDRNSIRTDYHSDQHNGSSRFPGTSRNPGVSIKGRLNSVNTGGYRRPGNNTSRGRGSGY